MITLRFKPRRVLIDVDTQQDLFFATGVASVRNHRRLLANIRRVMAAARIDQIPVISTAKVYKPSCGGRGYCLEGTSGLKKLRYTVRSNHQCFPASDSLDLPVDLLSKYDQVVFCKRCEDPFEEPRFDRMMTQLRADTFYLIGATAEGSVKATAIGLLSRGKNVTVLTDAVGTRDRTASNRAFKEMTAKGAVLTKAIELFGRPVSTRVHACPCRYCQAAD